MGVLGGLTLAITWPQVVYIEEDSLAEPAQVDGCVRQLKCMQRDRGTVLFIRE
jgi:hypothetical protein